MKHIFTPKHKLYSCKDSIIYYQKAPDQIVFMIDEDATSQIAKWEEETPYSMKKSRICREQWMGVLVIVRCYFA
jgi:hypothetical protein